MGLVVLSSDVHTHYDDLGLLSGSLDVGADSLGGEQAVGIASFLTRNYHKINKIISSDQSRAVKILHQIRLILTNKQIESRQTIELNDRNFGVLDSSPMDLQSDMFTSTRILAEEGESVSQCRDRVMSFLSSAIMEQDRVILISHPFACQIISNVVLNKNHCLLTEFWQKKGAIMSFRTRKTYGLMWEFVDAFDGLNNTPYSCDEIYRNLLGTKRDNSIQSPVGRETLVPMSDA